RRLPYVRVRCQSEVVVGRERDNVYTIHDAARAIAVEGQAAAQAVHVVQQCQLIRSPRAPAHATSSSAAANVVTMRSISAAVMVSGGTTVSTGPIERDNTPRLTMAAA